MQPVAVDLLGPQDSNGDYPVEVSCFECGRRLQWRVIVKFGESDYRTMGRRCAQKLCDPADGALARAQITHPGIIEWLGTQSHPKGWSGKTRLDDVKYWVGKRDKPDAVWSAETDYRKAHKEQRREDLFAYAKGLDVDGLTAWEQVLSPFCENLQRAGTYAETQGLYEQARTALSAL
jgi:hypothetical protein